MTSPLLEVHDLVKTFPASGRGTVRAIDGVSFTLDPGETLGLVGESGCGKSTTARLLLGLIRPTSGRILFGGRDIAGLRGRQLRALRRDIQMVFQDPFSSLDPRMTVDALLREPLRVHGLSDAGTPSRIAELLDVVGLPRAMGGRYPHELSGGQQQRVGIARALVLDPKVLLLDEPVSALDVSIRSQVLNLLVDLQSRFGFAFLFISHDLSVVRHVSHRVAVMYLGRIVETGAADSLYRRALHPYSQALLSAVPIADPRVERARRRILLTGDPPSALNPPPGCSFHPRCWKREEVCEETSPPLEPHDPLAGNHLAACHFAAPDLSMTAGRAGTPPLAGVPPGEAVRGSSSESS